MARRRLSVRARWLWGIGAALGLTAAVVAALVFQPWLLFIDVRVDDEIPATVATAPAAPIAEPADDITATPSPPPPAGPVDLLAGTFVSHEHPTTGTARVIEHPDGTRQLAIESLETTNGPDVHVWLSAGRSSRDSTDGSRPPGTSTSTSARSRATSAISSTTSRPASISPHSARSTCGACSSPSRSARPRCRNSQRAPSGIRLRCPVESGFTPHDIRGRTAMTHISDSGLSVAVVGATGQVGTVMREILAERAFPIRELRLFATARSAGTAVEFAGQTVVIEDVETADPAGIDIALFSAGATGSRAHAPRFAEAGATVIDNSSAWRMDPEVPLVVSEVNPHAIGEARKGIIANPNCTTMAAMPVLKVLDADAGLERLIVSTYQAVSGSGIAGARGAARSGRGRARPGRHAPPRARRLGDRLPAAREVHRTDRVRRHPVRRQPRRRRLTTRPTRRRSSATRAARSSSCPTSASPARACAFRSSPATRCSINAEFARDITPERAREVLAAAPGVVLEEVPTPLQAAGKDPSFVGRIRADQSAPEGKGLVLFISNDNLRKGAALNAVQIAELVAAGSASPPDARPPRGLSASTRTRGVFASPRALPSGSPVRAN